MEQKKTYRFGLGLSKTPGCSHLADAQKAHVVAAIYLRLEKIGFTSLKTPVLEPICSIRTVKVSADRRGVFRLQRTFSQNV